jgi:hypothetical protein
MIETRAALNEFAAVAEKLEKLEKWEKPHLLKMPLFSQWQLQAKSFKGLDKETRKCWHKMFDGYIVATYSQLVKKEWEFCNNKTIIQTEFYLSLKEEDKLQILTLTNKQCSQ